MKIKLIRSEADYWEALSRYAEIFDARPGTEEKKESEMLEILIEQYEDEILFKKNSGNSEIKILRMELRGYRQHDLCKIFG
ncbi:MAG: hypothetical protein IAF38_07645 [Bacteroidia bacterium]|nr:hypothetical protein [Bacteroidia bacterium]